VVAIVASLVVSVIDGDVVLTAVFVRRDNHRQESSILSLLVVLMGHPPATRAGEQLSRATCERVETRTDGNAEGALAPGVLARGGECCRAEARRGGVWLTDR
jgi:hypothetical protein